MGAGISKQALNSRLRYRLQRIVVELRNAGVECAYKNFQVFSMSDAHDGFNIKYRVLRASNGECGGILQVYVPSQSASGWKNLTLEGQKGIDNLKQMFGEFDRYVVKHTATGDKEIAVARTKAEAQSFAEADARIIAATTQGTYEDILKLYTVEGRNV